MTQRILFAPIHGQSMLEMLPIAEKVASDHRFEPIFFVYNEIAADKLRLLGEKGIRSIDPKVGRKLPPDKNVDLSKTHIASGNRKGVLQNKGKRFIKKVLSFSLISFLWYLLKLGRIIRRSRKLLEEENITAVVVIGDRHVGWETALIKSANDRNIPTLIVPFAMSDPTSDVENRLRSPESDQYIVSKLVEKIFSRFYPSWIKENAGKKMLFLPVGNALAAEVLGIMSENPWTIGGGAAIRMAVESQRVKEILLGEGVPLEKMVITGKPSVDQIYVRMQNVEEIKFRRIMGIPLEKKIILCSVPQLAEHGLLSWSDHWRETEFLFKTLSKQPNAVVLLNLHPQSDPTDYHVLAGKYRTVIVEDNIYELIPICDLLVATYSSVVVQAIGCSKPAVVVDFYGLDYTYYDNEPGVFVVKDHAKLSPAIQRLLYNDDYYHEVIKAQNQRSPDWIMLDGQCTDRVVNKLYQMIGE